MSAYNNASCKVCRDAGKTEKEYKSHTVRKFINGISVVCCPTLLSQECRRCGNKGHTVKFCTLVFKQPYIENPIQIENVIKPYIENTILCAQSADYIASALQKETMNATVGFPECPRVINYVNLPEMVSRMRIEPVEKQRGNSEYEFIFVLSKDESADITRAIQEDQILKTRLKLKKGNQVIDLPSFWDVWRTNKGLSKAILSSTDPNEEKWKCTKTYGYKIATTFMPLYAKSIYEHFNARTVLDPCSGWGDRLIGAAASSCVEKYVSFDPNHSLRPGYAKLMELFNHSTVHIDNDTIKFSNNFQCNSLPFEKGAISIEADSFDLVFTSPPFFDYEVYNESNPKYKNWIKDFYTPLFIQSCRCVKIGGHVAIHIGNTVSGEIETFLKNTVHLLCPLQLIHKIGLQGQYSGETRAVWIFKKEGREMVKVLQPHIITENQPKRSAYMDALLRKPQPVIPVPLQVQKIEEKEETPIITKFKCNYTPNRNWSDNSSDEEDN